MYGLKKGAYMSNVGEGEVGQRALLDYALTDRRATETLLDMNVLRGSRWNIVTISWWRQA